MENFFRTTALGHPPSRHSVHVVHVAEILIGGLCPSPQYLCGYGGHVFIVAVCKAEYDWSRRSGGDVRAGAVECHPFVGIGDTAWCGCCVCGLRYAKTIGCRLQPRWQGRAVRWTRKASV